MLKNTIKTKRNESNHPKKYSPLHSVVVPNIDQRTENICFKQIAAGSIQFKSEIIESRNSNVSYLFNETEFENLTRKLLEGESSDFENFKQEG